MQTFVGSLDTMFGGFRQRAEATYRLLQADGHGVPGGGRAGAGRPARGRLLHRTAGGREHAPGRPDPEPRAPGPVPELSAEKALAAAEELDADSPDPRLAAGLLRLHAERMRLSARERRLAERFTASQPNVAVAEIPAQSGDIHDLEGLRLAGDLLADGG